MVYIHKQIGFWQVEDLPDSYLQGTALEEYENGAYIALSDEQIAFHESHPSASQTEVWNMQLSIPIRTVKCAIEEKLMQIEMYDRSEAVNSFVVNGISTWLTPDVRSNYKNSIESAELLGETHITFIIAGIVATTTLPEARVMLAKIQRYADNCTIVTKTHKEEVKGLIDIVMIDAYDYAAGYPNKEEFFIIQKS